MNITEVNNLDYTRAIFDRLMAEGNPVAARRQEIYQEFRARVAAEHAQDGSARERALVALEKVIRRQEMQAIYEEGL